MEVILFMLGYLVVGGIVSLLYLVVDRKFKSLDLTPVRSIDEMAIIIVIWPIIAMLAVALCVMYPFMFIATKLKLVSKD